MTSGNLTTPQTVFVILCSYLIFTTNFVDAILLFHGAPLRFNGKNNPNPNRREEFQGNSYPNQISRNFKPSQRYPLTISSKPCCNKPSSIPSIDKFDAFDDYDYINTPPIRRFDHAASSFRRRPVIYNRRRPPLHFPSEKKPTLLSNIQNYFNPFRGNSVFQNIHNSFLSSLRRIYPSSRPPPNLPDPAHIDYGINDDEYNDYPSAQDILSFEPIKKQQSILERVADWFEKFKPPNHQSNINNSNKKASSEPSLEEHHTLDEDYNLIYYNQSNNQTPAVNRPQYSFQDVLQGLRKNESSVILIKKFLSAASALSERSGSDPVFMLWTIPTTLFAFLGLFYFFGAAVILGYKYILFVNDSANGQAVKLLPVLISFLVPIGLATLFVTSRSVINGEISPQRVVRGGGDVNQFFREDFDPIHFGLDTGFGTFALLGIGWLVSIAI